MKVSIVDLRYKMKKVLQALHRRENVTILYHGKPAGTLVPVSRKAPRKELRGHAFFGMHETAAKTTPVKQVIDKLRGGRYDAI